MVMKLAYSTAKIMIVDDDESIVNLLTTILEVEGFQTIEAQNGREALERLRREDPDLILLDIMMPEMDGYEFLSCLRSNPSTQHLPVIMVTAKSGKMDILRGWRSGADEYITKPFEPSVLINTIKSLIGKSITQRRKEREGRIEKMLQVLEDMS
jgi:DNA-binding response OmpR family regulator